MKYIWILIIAMGIWSNTGNAQDALFSQFYALPMSLNPGLAGTYEGKYRIGGMYRDQWRSALEEPFTTYALGLDLRFDLDPRGISKDFFSAGIYFQSDKAGFLEYTLNQMYLTGSFHKSLDNTKYHYLGAGIQIGMNQRNVNFSKVTFQDQFNGIDGYTLPTLELFPENNFAHADFSAGVSYIYAPPRQVAIYGGIAFHHLMGANTSFFNRDSRPNVMLRGEEYTLPMRITAHLASTIPLGDLLHLQPRGMIALQAETVQYNAGAMFKFFFPAQEATNLFLGAYFRGSNGVDTWRSDIPGIMVGYGLNNLFMGMSYDFSLNSVSRFGKTRGSFELSISYFGNYDNEDDMCPRF